jgi:hypothetical protein
MARETKVQKAQREVRKEGERLDRCMEYRGKYPERLMDALGRATKLGWEIDVVEGAFRVAVAGNGLIRTLLPYSIGLVERHSNLEHVIDFICEEEKKRKKEMKREMKREEIRKGALEKLSVEEREALGL